MRLTKGNVTIGVHTRFGPNWPGIRCLAKTRRGTKCQSAAYKHNGRCRLHGGLSTGARTPEGLQRISETNHVRGWEAREKRRIRAVKFCKMKSWMRLLDEADTQKDM